MNRIAAMRAASDGERWNKVRWYEERHIVRARQEGASVRELVNRFRLRAETIRRILRTAG